MRYEGKYLGGSAEGLSKVGKLASKGAAIKVTRIQKGNEENENGCLYLVTIKAVAPKGKLWFTGQKTMVLQFDTDYTWFGFEPWNQEDSEATEEELIKDLVAYACQ